MAVGSLKYDPYFCLCFQDCALRIGAPRVKSEVISTVTSVMVKKNGRMTSNYPAIETR